MANKIKEKITVQNRKQLAKVLQDIVDRSAGNQRTYYDAYEVLKTGVLTLKKVLESVEG